MTIVAALFRRDMLGSASASLSLARGHEKIDEAWRRISEAVGAAAIGRRQEKQFPRDGERSQRGQDTGIRRNARPIGDAMMRFWASNHVPDT